MKIILLVISILTVSQVGAQDSTTVFVAAGRSIYEAATPARMYRFPKFSPGKIFFRDGTTTGGNLNYNLFNEEIEFITAQGDTMAIAKHQMLNIGRVAVSNKSFYFNNYLKHGYLEEVLDAQTGKLFKRERYALVNREKIGGYNQPSATSAIESYGNFTNNQGVMETNLLVKENLTFKKRTDYFFSDKFNHSIPANKKNLYRVFSKKKNGIDKYLNNNQVDFNKEEDLVRLLSYLQSI
jgi:hypothetical protein